MESVSVSLNFVIFKSWDSDYFWVPYAAAQSIDIKLPYKPGCGTDYTLEAKGCLNIWELQQMEIIRSGQTLFMSCASAFLGEQNLILNI